MAATQAPITNTTQDALGRVTLVHFPDYNMMVWNGTDAAHTLNMAQCPTGSAVFSSFPTVFSGFSSTQTDTALARYENSAVNGPCFVLAPNQVEGYVVLVEPTGSIIVCATKLVPGSKSYAWELVVGTEIVSESKATSGYQVITGSKAAGAPAAAMGLQNGRLVLNIVWQDAGAGCMVLAQIEVGNPQATLSFKPLNQSCIGQPSLVMQGGISFLAWSGLDKSFNMAIDPAGGVDFQFDDHLVDSSRPSPLGPCLVPINNTQLYVVSASVQGIQYAQFAMNQFGQWGFNPASGCSGIVPGTGISLGGPYAHRDDGTDGDGQTFPALAVVWPDQFGNILTTNIPVSLAPVPIIQAALG